MHGAWIDYAAARIGGLPEAEARARGPTPRTMTRPRVLQRPATRRIRSA